MAGINKKEMVIEYCEKIEKIEKARIATKNIYGERGTNILKILTDVKNSITDDIIRSYDLPKPKGLPKIPKI